MQQKFTGTGVALITPFKEDQSVDYNGLKKLLEHTINNGIDYLVVNGTTGESATTTEEERNDILSFVLKENLTYKKPVMYGIGANNTSAVIKKIVKTDFTGVDAILSVCPYYNKPSQEGIFQHYKAIAESSPIPIMLYNVPGRTGINMSAQTTIRLSEVPNIIGIKEAHSDLTQPLEIIGNVRKDFLLISGDDLLTVPMMSLGARGVISVLANAYPAQFSSLVKNALSNDYKKATETLALFTEINPLMYVEGNPVGVKYILENMGICGSQVRLPLVKGSAELQAKIKQAIQKLK